MVPHVQVRSGQARPGPGALLFHPIIISPPVGCGCDCVACRRLWAGRVADDSVPDSASSGSSSCCAAHRMSLVRGGRQSVKVAAATTTSAAWWAWPCNVLCVELSLRVASPRTGSGLVSCLVGGACGKTLLSSRDTSGDCVSAEVPLSVCWHDWHHHHPSRLLTNNRLPDRTLRFSF